MNTLARILIIGKKNDASAATMSDAPPALAGLAVEAPPLHA
jgi:hypothetical protein